jgi:transcriptional regulator with XRE-family HTH domain
MNKNKHLGSTLQSMFEELGELEEVRSMAAKKVLAMDVARRMKKLGLTTTTLAERMGTSRSQVHRILNEDDTGVTLKVLLRLADVLGTKLAHARARRQGRHLRTTRSGFIRARAGTTGSRRT